ncbi:hypothetical protein MED121_22312 [Marinomonas sp. MED121]|uniref:HlyD family type I secretion periplasmic adaptor subunit n=1 Tax=Marinomonas sp. MED121 TaxID=314277 RepID=UPI000068FDC0|nr:HlyD family type I secretion periplasmic adaptor subunit [Marinomonas sp. MED121]EAQ65452.1 hypothetical protein MED121_22312 [Marinomonas sp. MED121]
MLRKYFNVARQAMRKERQEQETLQRSNEEYEFQPGYLEIVERPPAPWARRTAIALTLLLLIVIIWSFIGRLDIHATTQGRLIISSHSKIIQSLEPGEIKAINVQDGQLVTAGETLISLNPVGAAASVQELKQQLDFQRLRQSRLQALLTDNPLDNFKMTTAIAGSSIALTRQHLISEWQEVQANLANLNAQMDTNIARVSASNRQIESLQKLAININERLDARQALSEQNYYPKLELLEQVRESLESERAINEKRSELEVLKKQYAELEGQKRSYLAEKQREYSSELNDVLAEIGGLTQQLVIAKEKQRLMKLLAPVDGVVQQLAVHTLAGVVQSAQQLMVIVPANMPLEAEVKVLNKDVGFVRENQPVELKIDAFPFTRYGTISGEVIHVSRDAIEDEQLGMVFTARIKLASNSMVVENETVPLQAGMSLVGEVRTNDRRVIDYLLSPLQQYQSEAMRER